MRTPMLRGAGGSLVLALALLAASAGTGTTTAQATDKPAFAGNAGQAQIQLAQSRSRVGRRSFATPRRFSSSVTSGLLRRDRSFGGSRVLGPRVLPLVRGSRLGSATLFGPSPNGFRRGLFDDSRTRALRAEALALDAAARLRELGLTPAQKASQESMPPALVRALILAKEARAKAAGDQVAEDPVADPG